MQHLAAADPFDPVLRDAATRALAALGEEVVPEGTTVVIQGPRFSTRAESFWFRSAGADIVNMTQYPEAVLAAELGLGLVTICFVTDTDAGTAAGDTSDAADAALVLERMAQAGPRIRAADRGHRRCRAGRLPASDADSRRCRAPCAVRSRLRGRCRMTHLIVTGGLGFIGSHVVEAAAGSGWRVTVVDSLRPDVHATAEVPGWFSTLRGDVDLLVGDAGTIPEALLRSADAVCHQAAKVGLGVDFSDAPDYVESNVGVTARLLAGMAAAGTTRLVLASSMVVYGEGLYRDGDAVVQPPARAVDDLRAGRFDPLDREGRPLQPLLIGEDDPTEPRNVYAVSKLAQEQLARSWARSTGGRVVALRYHNVFGARMPSGTPYAGVASLFRSRLDEGLAPLVFEDGRQRRDFVDVARCGRRERARDRVAGDATGGRRARVQRR